MITVIGKSPDGALVGQDEQGNLRRGRIRRAGWDEVQRAVTDLGDGNWQIDYVVGDYLISRATMRAIPDAEYDAYFQAVIDAKANGTPPPVQPTGFNPKYHDYTPHKQHISVPLPDGTNMAFERLIDVQEWEAI